jgi:hypothetical protein
MGWDSKRYYPVDAHAKVTVKATDSQKVAWTYAAKKLGKGTPGAFLAWAADMAIAFVGAYEKTQERHLEEMDR